MHVRAATKQNRTTGGQAGDQSTRPGAGSLAHATDKDPTNLLSGGSSLVLTRTGVPRRGVADETGVADGLTVTVLSVLALVMELKRLTPSCLVIVAWPSWQRTEPYHLKRNRMGNAHSGHSRRSRRGGGWCFIVSSSMAEEYLGCAGQDDRDGQERGEGRRMAICLPGRCDRRIEGSGRICLSEQEHADAPETGWNGQAADGWWTDR